MLKLIGYADSVKASQGAYMSLRREDVIDAAVELLDEVGLDAFTTRALTDRLGVQRGALYWHVKSKHELLGAVAAKIVAPAFTADDDSKDWANAFADFAQRLRMALLGHRDAARLVAVYSSVDRQTSQSMQANLARLNELGIPPALAARFGDLMASYVTGYVLQEQAQQAAADSHAIFTACVATITTGMRAELADIV